MVAFGLLKFWPSATSLPRLSFKFQSRANALKSRHVFSCLVVSIRGPETGELFAKICRSILGERKRRDRGGRVTSMDKYINGLKTYDRLSRIGTVVL